jgi:hypothetical protein
MKLYLGRLYHSIGADWATATKSPTPARSAQSPKRSVLTNDLINKGRKPSRGRTSLARLAALALPKIKLLEDE